MRLWLKQMRLTKGYTQKQVADECGISRSYYADIERGIANAGGKTAKAISEVLGFDMSLFFESKRRVSRQKERESA